MQNILFRERYAFSLDLFYPNGAMRRTAKSNLLNETEIAPSWCNWYGFHGNTRVYSKDFLM